MNLTFAESTWCENEVIAAVDCWSSSPSFTTEFANWTAVDEVVDSHLSRGIARGDHPLQLANPRLLFLRDTSRERVEALAQAASPSASACASVTILTGSPPAMLALIGTVLLPRPS